MFKTRVYFEIIILAHVYINNLTRTKISLTKNLGLLHKFSSSLIVAFRRYLGTLIYNIENIETRYLRIFHTLAVEDMFFTFFFRHHCYGCKMAVLGRGYLSQHVLESS